MKRLEIAAAALSAAILIIATVFWIIQIRGAREMLEKAYGGG